MRRDRCEVTWWPSRGLGLVVGLVLGAGGGDLRAAGGPGKRLIRPVRFLRGVAAYARWVPKAICLCFFVLPQAEHFDRFGRFAQIASSSGLQATTTTTFLPALHTGVVGALSGMSCSFSMDSPPPRRNAVVMPSSLLFAQLCRVATSSGGGHTLCTARLQGGVTAPAMALPCRYGARRSCSWCVGAASGVTPLQVAVPQHRRQPSCPSHAGAARRLVV